MKLISEHLGQIIAALAAVALLITSVVFFKAPIGDFFDNTVSKMTGIGDNIVANLDDVDVTEPTAPLSYYAAKVKTAQKLYDVGEANLTDADVVQVNGVDCYVLRVEGNKALMMTKYIYAYSFNWNSSQGCDYSTSALKTSMDNFYFQDLGSDPHIVDTTVTYYTKDSLSNDLNTFTSGTLTQKVFALDAKEAQANASKFGSSSWSSYRDFRAPGFVNLCLGFWVTAGCNDNGDYNAFSVKYNGTFDKELIINLNTGGRPCFWLSLD